MFYSLTQSGTPVTRVVVELNGAEQGRVEGVDLRGIIGNYFTLPAAVGRYQLVVTAYNADGCFDGGPTRPMTVTVN